MNIDAIILNFWAAGWFNICKSINVIYHINRTKDKNHMITSIESEKAFGRLDPFMIKTSNKLGIKGIITMWEMPYMTLKAFPQDEGDNKLLLELSMDIDLLYS